MTLPTNCGPCDCNCIVADHLGRPYPVGRDAQGNQAIIVPSAETRCGMFEFVHQHTTCQVSAYPLVALDDNVTLTAAAGVLSAADSAPVIIALKVNGVQVSSLTIPAGQTVVRWPTATFPISLSDGDTVETAILSAGANQPAVSIQAIICTPGPSVDLPAAGDPVEEVLFEVRGALAVGQDPTDLAIPATAPGLSYYEGAGQNHGSLYLVGADAGQGLAHHRIWPPDPATIPWSIVAWDSGVLDATPAVPAEPANPAIAVDIAGNEITHRWDTSLQQWVLFVRPTPQRIELGQAGSHRPPTGPVALTWFRQAGTLQVDIIGTDTAHAGGDLTVAVVDEDGATLASFTLPASTRKITPTATIVVDASSGLGLKVTNTPPVPGTGVILVGTFTPAA